MVSWKKSSGFLTPVPENMGKCWSVSDIFLKLCPSHLPHGKDLGQGPEGGLIVGIQWLWLCTSNLPGSEQTFQLTWLCRAPIYIRLPSALKLTGSFTFSTGPAARFICFKRIVL